MSADGALSLGIGGLGAGLPAELAVIAGLAAIQLVLIFVQQIHNDLDKGAAWALSNRADQAFSPFGARVGRALANHVENTVIFAPVALIVVIAELATPVTGIASLVYLGARVVYAASYVAGIIGLRSAAWFVGVFATVATGWPIIGALI